MNDSLDLRNRILKMRESNNLNVTKQDSLNNNLMSEFESSIKDDNKKERNSDEETVIDQTKESVPNSNQNRFENLIDHKDKTENQNKVEEYKLAEILFKPQSKSTEIEEIEEIKESIKEDSLIISGLNFEDPQKAAIIAKEMLVSGADAILIFPPFSWSQGISTKMIYEHHKIISESFLKRK